MASIMELQVGVKVLLQNREGKYLLIRRSGEKYQEVVHKWDIPGGRINPGATLSDNLAREVDEETGLQMTSEPRLIAAQDILPTPEKHVVRLTYLGEAEGELRLSDEHDGFRWVTMDELKTFENLDRYLRKLLDEGVIS